MIPCGFHDVQPRETTMSNFTAQHTNGARFYIVPVLVNPANPDAPHHDWKARANTWEITLSSPASRHTMRFPYHMGPGLVTDDGKPRTPDAKDVLASVGMDVATALELPPCLGAAMDYLASELGMDDSPPSRVLQLVLDLRDTLANVRLLLEGTNLTIPEFVEFCASFDE